MFYLGGLTLGYLTPYPVQADAVAAVKTVKSKMPAAAPVQADSGRNDAAEERPILWPWHIFY